MAMMFILLLRVVVVIDHFVATAANCVLMLK